MKSALNRLAVWAEDIDQRGEDRGGDGGGKEGKGDMFPGERAQGPGDSNRTLQTLRSGQEGPEDRGGPRRKCSRDRGAKLEECGFMKRVGSSVT